jgi:hypothetical protein
MGMSLLTDEGLPDPSQMNIFEQMTVGQLENWWTQTQELGAALGLDGWTGPDAEQHRQFLLQEHQSTQQHQDAMHVIAEIVLWAIDTLQLIMTILLIIQILRAIILACSTIIAVFTAGVSESLAAEASLQLAIMEGIKRAIIFALRQMLQLVFRALPKLLLRLLPGEVAGAATGFAVAANTVNSQHLSGSAAAGVYLQDMGFGALTGASLQAGLSSGNPLAWKLLGAGTVVTAGNVAAQSIVTGQGPTLQSVFDAANADLGLPEGTLQVAEAASEVGAFRTRFQLGRGIEGPQGVETQCLPAALYDKLALAGKTQSLADLSADSGWRPGDGTWLSEGGPRAMAGVIARDPSILEGMGASPEVVAVARRAQAGDQAALAQFEASFQFKGGLTLDELNRAYSSTDMTVTVVTKLGDGAHALEFAGLRDGHVFLIDGSTGEVRSLRAAQFLQEWRGGQALMPDLGALGIRPEVTRLNPLTRAYEHLTGLDDVGATAPETVEELPVLGPDDATIAREFRKRLNDDVAAGRCSTKLAAEITQDPYGQLTEDGKQVETSIKRYNIGKNSPDYAPDDMVDKAWAVGQSDQPIAVRADGSIVYGHGDEIPSGFDINRPGYDNRTDQVDELVRQFETLEGQGHPDPPYYTRQKSPFDNAVATSRRKASGWDGAYFESHAEKQAGMIGDQSLPKAIGVNKEACLDCRWYHQTKARVTGAAQYLTDPQATRIFEPNGSVIVIPHGSRTAYIYSAQTAYDMWMSNFSAANYWYRTP